jgi:hypothetical protein
MNWIINKNRPNSSKQMVDIFHGCKEHNQKAPVREYKEQVWEVNTRPCLTQSNMAV